MDKKSEILGELYAKAESNAAAESLFDQLMSVDLRYLCMGYVGSGAMKEITRTEDRKTARMVAMALLKDPNDKRAVESFLREARINARLQHPHIVPVYDIDINEHQQPYFTMKLIPGSSLKQILDELAAGKSEALEKYKLPVLLDIFLKVCEAMAYSHSEGICHYDLKPDNIRVSNFGDVMVCDWGLAGFIGEEPTEHDKVNGKADNEKINFTHYDSRYMTIQGQIKGTPGYMAPEQASDKREPKDERTDVFALGCILYEILTHRSAIEGESLAEILKNTRTESIISPSLKRPDLEIPASLEAVCMKAVKISPSERYSEVQKIINEIESYRQGFATKAEEPSLFKRFSLFYRRNAAFCNTALAFLLILIAVTVVFIVNIRLEKQIAVKALEELKVQQKLTTSTLDKLQSQYAFKKKIGSETSILFAKKAIVELKKQDLSKAKEFVKTSLLLDDGNSTANYTMAKIKMVEGQYESAKSILKKFSDTAESDLLSFCEVILNIQNKKKLTFKDIYKLLVENVSSQRTPFINLVLKSYMSSFSNIEKLEKEMAWLLEKKNKLTNVQIKIEYRNNKFSIDVSNNPDLKEIDLLRVLPLSELNISNTSVNNIKLLSEMPLEVLNMKSTPITSLQFALYMPSLKRLHISQGVFPKVIIKHLSKKMKVIKE